MNSNLISENIQEQVKKYSVKVGLKSEDTRGFLLIQNKHSKLPAWAENLNKLVTFKGVKFKFPAQEILYVGNGTKEIIPIMRLGHL